MSDIATAEGFTTSPTGSIRERVVDFAKKTKLIREKTPEQMEREKIQAEAIAEWKRVSKILLAEIKRTRDAYHRAPVSDSTNKFSAFAGESGASHEATVAYREAVSQYRNFLFQTLGEEKAELFLYDEADKAAGKHTSLLVSKVLGGVAGAGFVIGGGGLKAVASIVPGFIISKTLMHKKAIGVVSARVANKIATKEVEAKERGQTHEEFMRGNSALLKERRLSKLWRFSARWGVGLTTSVGTYGLLHHSLSQIAAGLSDHAFHNTLAHNFGDRMAENVMNGTGDYWRFLAWSRAMTQEIGHNALHGLAVLNKEIGLGGPAGAAPLESGPQGAPQVAEPKVHLVTHLATAPNAVTRVEAFTPKSIAEAADGLIKGGMPPEARDAFIKAATAQASNKTPEYVDFTKRVWEAMVYRVKGVEHVLGIGDEKIMLDSSRDIRAATAPPVMYRAEEFPVDYKGADGQMHRLIIDVPEGTTADGKEKCFNFAFYKDEVIPPSGATIPPPETKPVVTPTPEVKAVINKAQWWTQSGGTIIADCLNKCSSEDRVANLTGINYIGESPDEARAYVLASVKEGVLGKAYQAGLSDKFIDIKFTSSLTGKVEFLCLNLRTGSFSHPFIEVNGKAITITSEKQFEDAITGNGETLRMTGGRLDDRTVLFPQDVIPLTGVDTDGDGIPNRLIPGADANLNGILEASEIGRTRGEIIKNQLNFIGRGIIPDIETNPADLERLRQTFLSQIPEGFINGKTEGDRFLALKAVFGGILNDAEIRKLGGDLHLYGEVLTPRAGEKGLAPFTTPDGKPETVYDFFKTAIGKEADIGVFGDLRKQ